MHEDLSKGQDEWDFFDPLWQVLLKILSKEQVGWDFWSPLTGIDEDPI